MQEEIHSVNNERVTKAELARRAGFSRAWISKLASQGKLIFESDGKINYASALKQLEGSKDHNREAQRAHAKVLRGGSAEPTKPSVELGHMNTADETIYDSKGKVIYGNIHCKNSEIGVETQRSRLLRETYEARLKELELEQKFGELVPLKTIVETNEKIASSMRTKLLALPSKMASVLEGLKPAEIQVQLEDMINSILTEINSMAVVDE